jgi:membrane-bound ClpP family serine protease
MKKRSRIRRKGMNYWSPRISAILFVVLMYAIIGQDFLKTLAIHPILYNFLIGTIILAVTIVVWKQDGKTGGFFYVIIGAIYFLIMRDKLLWVSVAATSFWLIVTGLLFLLDRKSPDLSKNHKKLSHPIDNELLNKSIYR